MAGISRCLTFLEDNMCDSVSSGYMDEYVFRLTNLRKEIKKLKYIKLQEVDDISKIVLVVNDGKNLYDKLLNARNINGNIIPLLLLKNNIRINITPTHTVRAILA